MLRLNHVEEFRRQITLSFEEAKCTLMTLINSHFDNEGRTGCSEFDVAYIIMQVLSVLAYLHHKGYVHRDVKPENFVVVEDDLLPIKLVSLSTVAEVGSSGVKGTVGTYLYMAPEVVLGRFYGKNVDVWSAGIIAYMLLTGSHPLVDLRAKSHAADSYREEMKQFVMSEKTSLVNRGRLEVRTITKEGQNFLERLLEIDPRKRISAADALKDPWIVTYCRLRRKEKIIEIEQELLHRKDLREVLMNIISVACAPNFKIMLLDRMCSQSKFARENGYPEVNRDAINLYREIFYLVNAGGVGCLSKSELAGRNLGVSFSQRPVPERNA